MEKTTFSEPQEGTIAFHFSHQHPLQLTTYKQTLNLSSPCSGCNLKPAGMLYACMVCKYYLHKTCFEIPRQITHPYHKKHALTLLTEPDETFICDACGERGKGFSYHCTPCVVDLHVHCAAMPLTISHDCHLHKLNLTFQSPFAANQFFCSVCRSTASSSYWLYRCGSCVFDAHLNCVKGGRPHVSPSLRKYASLPSRQATQIISETAPSLSPQHPRQQSFTHDLPMNDLYPIEVPAEPSWVPPPTDAVNVQNNNLATQQTIVYNNAVVAQAIPPRRAGGSYGGDRRLQQAIQLMAGITHGIGGGQNIVQGRVGGNDGEEGQGLLQSLLDGGNGFDFLGGFSF